jgi:hypothetical protein
MQEEQEVEKRKSVLGLRLSYLSKIPSVRQTVSTQMQQGGDLLEIMRPLTVGAVEIDVRDNDKQTFANKLNELQVALGDQYLEEPEVKDHETDGKREHDWDDWEKAFNLNEALRGQLHRVIAKALSYNREIDAYGTYRARRRAVVEGDRENPRVEFHVEDQYTTEKGEGRPYP